VASRIAISIAIVFGLFATACSGDDDPSPPADAPTGGDAAVCVGTVELYAACTMDSECMGCTCRSFGHAKACTKTCTIDADCGTPATTCNTMGFCRPPPVQ
jgi:hypothetical protein